MKQMCVWVLLSLWISAGFPSALGQTKPNVGPNSVQISDTERELGLIWPSSLVPGEEVAMVKVTFSRYEETFYHRYEFAGVVGGSLKINQTGANQPKGATSAQASSSMAKTIYVERADDGAFYFVPEDLKNLGAFRIQRSEHDPGVYSVTFSRRKE